MGMRLWSGKVRQDETRESETQQQSRAGEQTGNDYTLYKRDSEVTNEKTNALSALFGFGQRM
jgi:hypothetical protein